MSEELLQPTPEEPITEETPSLMPGFKSICMRLGFVMIVIFGTRLLSNVCVIPIADWVNTLTGVSYYLFNAVYSIVFLYAIPMVATVFILNHPLKNSPNKVYQKPKYFGKAMAMLPAGYGLAITVRLLTMLLSMLFKDTALGESFDVVQDSLMTAPDMPSAIVLFIQLTVVAPIFEELWFRGFVMESLRPYGNGFAIFISAILFGLTHGNFEQFFYATALGIFLGYIAISTKSIITTTIMHAIFNSISGFMLLLSVDPAVQEFLSNTDPSVKPEMTPSVVLYFVWLIAVALLLVVGIIMMIYKLIKIKRYKVPKVQTEIPTGKRWAIFFTSATVIIGIILAAFCFAEPAIIKFISDVVNESSKITESISSTVALIGG